MLNSEPASWQAMMKRWLADIRTRHPLAKKNKTDILKELRQTRDEVWAERRKS